MRKTLFSTDADREAFFHAPPNVQLNCNEMQLHPVQQKIIPFGFFVVYFGHQNTHTRLFTFSSPMFLKAA
jgi:hypothetical protein